jgi:hypothetical protein
MFLKKLKLQQKTFKQALIIWPGLPKMNIPQIPDMEEIKRKMAEANMNFPEPVSYPDQLQAIRDLPPMNQMPTREEIQMAMQIFLYQKKHLHQPKQFKKKYKWQCKICQRLYQNQWSFPAFRSFLLQYHKCPTREEIQIAMQICQRQLLPFQACQSLICHKCNPLGFLNK